MQIAAKISAFWFTFVLFLETLAKSNERFCFVLGIITVKLVSVLEENVQKMNFRLCTS